MVPRFPISNRQIRVSVAQPPTPHRIPLRLGRIVHRHIIRAQSYNPYGRVCDVRIAAYVPYLVAPRGNRRERPPCTINEGGHPHLHIRGAGTRIIRACVPYDMLTRAGRDRSPDIARKGRD